MAAVVSAPGKVMVAGGYVVLERPNPALVAAVSARVYSVVAPLADSTAGSLQKLPQHEAYIEIEVLSPQMSQSRRYVVTCEGDACALSRADDMAQNEYVEATLINSIGLVAHLKGAARLRPFSVSIHGDNAFYVMENEDGSKAENLPRFAPITHASSDKAQHAANVRKTGLGSSAALVTSMVGAILSHFQVISLPSTDTSQLRLVHNLSQFCHCCAQGKIGSGFDVAAAVYGSMQYVRFSPAILDVKAHDSLSAAQPSVIAALVLATSSQGAGHFFDHSIEAWSLPPQMHLVVGDVRGSGSSTPSMVSAINKWRKDQPQEVLSLLALPVQKYKY